MSTHMNQPNTPPKELWRVRTVRRFTKANGERGETTYSRYYWTKRGAQRYGLPLAFSDADLGRAVETGNGTRTVFLERAEIGGFA